MTMQRRGFLGTVIASLALFTRNDRDTARLMSQWQWRIGEVGKEVEEVLKRVLGRCDIGTGQGTVSSAPRQHNVFHVWVDMDYGRVSAAFQKHGKVPETLRLRSYVIYVPVAYVLMSREEELVQAMQKAMAVARKRPQVRTWGQMLEPDSYDGMVDITKCLSDEEKTG